MKSGDLLSKWHWEFTEQRIRGELATQREDCRGLQSSPSSLQQNTDQHVHASALPMSQKGTHQMDESEPIPSQRQEGSLAVLISRSEKFHEILDRELNCFASGV